MDIQLSIVVRILMGKVMQLADVNAELAQKPKWEVCSSCLEVSECIQFIGATSPWLKAGLGNPNKIWRCKKCTPVKSKSLFLKDSAA
ncbi:hypothetical protein MHO82_13015 [Vibrio sp. Of7-15]|uniref:hypothetical protein n=1 Tax=Vibrio sp. Of7-15 TaxID=2724879 RepID=UPI001EF25AF0|nr:hypothetical protein [Vibrio sp. Of7-15]MCG7497785.1 hypothetical protein [Vibrio sp. Of7-15]